jgi:hypothetical protein
MGRMKRIDVTKKGDHWVAKAGDQVVAKAARKVDAVRKTASQAKKMPEAVAVKIHKEDGRIQEERTARRDLRSAPRPKVG